MKKTAAIVAIAGLAGAAAAQPTFLELGIIATNLTDGVRGTTNAQAGDVFQIDVVANHDGLSFGGVKVDLFISNTADGDVNFGVEDAGTLPPEFGGLHTAGRHPHLRNVVSDKGPAVGANLGANTISFAGGVMSDFVNFIDLVSFPPTQNPLIPSSPISTGEAIFKFQLTYQGGTVDLSGAVAGRGRVFSGATDGTGVLVDTTVGTASITPAPASLALLGLGGLAAARRRRA